jgi:ParB family chromosome partitioning protein|tara:strand:- start:535 stop:1380 length:846 start_codon:yes stop_codon:yes gene_type:complete
MNKEKNKLGRGLGSLLSSGTDTLSGGEDSLVIVSTSLIVTNSHQPRKDFKKEELQDLASSIRSQGILQPIVVRKKSENLYEIIAGERRWRAAQIAGIHEIPVIIKNMDDNQALQAALIENIQRENLNPVEEARAYQGLLGGENLDSDKLSNIVGKSKSHISNMIRLLELDEKILDLVIGDKISMGHARALIGVPNGLELAHEIINKKLSVREIEKNASKYKKKRKNKNNKDPNILDLEKELSEKIGLKTSIHFNDQGSSGFITLYYSDLDQLDELMKKLKK